MTSHDDEGFAGECPTCGQPYLYDKLQAAELRAQEAERECERLRDALSSMCSDVFGLRVPPGKAPEVWAREQAESMSRNFNAEIAEHQRHHDHEAELVEQARAEGYERGRTSVRGKTLERPPLVLPCPECGDDGVVAVGEMDEVPCPVCKGNPP